MTILYYDCFSGISGDMNLGALVNLGVDKKHLVKELNKLKIGDFRLKFRSEQRKGITGTRAYVQIPYNKEVHNRDHSTKRKSQEKHDHKHYNSEERSFKDIRELINDSDLDKTVKNRSLAIFQKVAEAEARIHGKTINEIHFHEVGAIDSIVDIVGAAICLEYLRPDKIISSSVEVGGGFVNCEHGILPVPAPATAEILKNIPMKSGAVQSEMTTPTGAAILATVADEFSDTVRITIRKTGYGIGTKDFDIPNVLRVYLGETDLSSDSDLETQAACIIECNIDDMNPEFYGSIMDLLFEKGADDVFIAPIIMKKARPASKLSVLCSPTIADEITDILITNTTTLGVRKHSVEKMVMKRDFQTINSKWGPVTIKTAIYKGKPLRSKPEYDDCVRIAKENNLPVRTVYQEINKLIASLYSDAD